MYDNICKKLRKIIYIGESVRFLFFRTAVTLDHIYKSITKSVFIRNKRDNVCFNIISKCFGVLTVIFYDARMSVHLALLALVDVALVQYGCFIFV